MKDFPATDQPAARLCTERVQGCEVYVGVLGTRYGSLVRDEPEVSYTELEFDTATKAGLARLVFLLDADAENVGIPLSALIDREFGERQDAFRRRVQDSGLVTQVFANPATLGHLVERSLRELAKEHRRGGEVGRGQVPTGLAHTFTLSCDVDALDGGGRADFGDEVGIAYLGGFKFRLALGNAGDRPMAIQSMRIDVQSYDLPALAHARPERAYGAALIPHQLFVELNRNSFTGWWVLSDGARLSSEPRPIDSSTKDIFESAGLPRIRFSLNAGEMEFIEGAFLAKEPGLYEVKLLALAVDAAQDRVAKSTSMIRLVYMEEERRG
jgi:hypothetical protein